MLPFVALQTALPVEGTAQEWMQLYDFVQDSLAGVASLRKHSSNSRWERTSIQELSFPFFG